MVEGLSAKSLTKKLFPRFLKAAIWGTLTYLLVYHLPMLIYPLKALPFEFAPQLLYLFVTIAVFFAVITQLFSGTVLGYAFGIAKALIMIAYFIYVFSGGVISLTMPISGTTVDLVVDLRAFLTMIISVNLLALAKNMLQITNLLAKKVETSQLSVRQ